MVDKRISTVFPAEVPKEERKYVILVSPRIAGITDMGVGNVNFFTSIQGLVTLLAQNRIIIITETT